MKTMPDIEITEADYQILRHAGEFSSGGEAIICRGNRPDTLYKIFQSEDEHLPQIMSDNKFRKILAQFEHPLEHCTHPISTISMNKELIGYEMTYDEEDIVLTPDLPRQELIQYLHQIRKILEYFSSKDIIYGDIKSNNILINRRTRQAKFCDMDNIQMGENPIDLIGYDLSCFIDEYGVLDETADIYMHNLLTLEQLSYPEKSYQSILYTLSAGKYPRHYQKHAKRIMQSMPHPTSFQKEYLIQYVKK